MRCILWCCLMLWWGGAQSQDSGFYAPQTYQNHLSQYDKGLFAPHSRPSPHQMMTHAPSLAQPGQLGHHMDHHMAQLGHGSPHWRQYAPLQEPWRAAAPLHHAPAPLHHAAPLHAAPAPVTWAPAHHAPAPLHHAPLAPSKERHAAILHHKQALTAEGGFEVEWSGDNGVSAAESIAADGARVGQYKYRDPSGQEVVVKYRAGKEGFQILEGSHLPKSPEPVAPIAPPQDGGYLAAAYEQQRRQFELQQQYNLQPRQEPERPQEQQNLNWRPTAGNLLPEDDGQYRENEVDARENRGPHTFGEGYSFTFGHDRHQQPQH